MAIIAYNTKCLVDTFTVLDEVHCYHFSKLVENRLKLLEIRDDHALLERLLEYIRTCLETQAKQDKKATNELHFFLTYPKAYLVVPDTMEAFKLEKEKYNHVSHKFHLVAYLVETDVYRIESVEEYANKHELSDCDVEDLDIENPSFGDRNLTTEEKTKSNSPLKLSTLVAAFVISFALSLFFTLM